MSYSPLLRRAALLAPLTLTAACASLGGNVESNFACRAPEGTCAPTSLIDDAATGPQALEVQAAPRPIAAPSDGVRRLRVVLAALGARLGQAQRLCTADQGRSRRPLDSSKCAKAGCPDNRRGAGGGVGGASSLAARGRLCA